MAITITINGSAFDIPHGLKPPATVVAKVDQVKRTITVRSCHHKDWVHVANCAAIRCMGCDEVVTCEEIGEVHSYLSTWDEVFSVMPDLYKEIVKARATCRCGAAQLNLPGHATTCKRYVPW